MHEHHPRQHLTGQCHKTGHFLLETQRFVGVPVHARPQVSNRPTSPPVRKLGPLTELPIGGDKVAEILIQQLIGRLAGDLKQGNPGGVRSEVSWFRNRILTLFAVGTDRLDFSALFQAAGYTGAEAARADFVQT